MYTKRNIAMYVILSIVTCGIFGYYWIYCIAQDYNNSRTPNAMDMSPGMILLLHIVTCGLFTIYCYYKWGKQTPEIFAMYGWQGEDRSLLYLLLSIFGFSIINMCLIQNDFNKLADAGQPPYQAPQQPYPPAGAAPQQPTPGAYPPPPAGQPYPQQTPAQPYAPPAGTYPQPPQPPVQQQAPPAPPAQPETVIPPAPPVPPQQPPMAPPPGSPYAEPQQPAGDDAPPNDPQS